LFLAAILIVIGVIAARMEIIEKVMAGLRDAKPPRVICQQGPSRTPLKYWGGLHLEQYAPRAHR